MRLEFVRDFKAIWGEVPTITVIMEYIPTLSVNRYKWQGRWTKAETRRWMSDLAFIIRVTANCAEIKFKAPLKVKIDGVFKNRRSTPDLHNLIPVVANAVEDGSGINDKDFLTETGVPQIGDDPRLIITISQA